MLSLASSGLSVATATAEPPISKPAAAAPVVGPGESWTANSHSVRNVDGTTTTTIYAAPTFGRRADGWAETSSDVTAVSPIEDAAVAGKADHALRPLLFGRARNRLVDVSVDGQTVRLSAPALAIGEPALDGAKVTYADVAKDASLEYVVAPDGLKERVVLATPAAPRSYTFHISDPTGVLGDVVAGADGVQRFSGQGADGLHLEIPKPFAYDATSATPTDDGSLSASLVVTRAGDGFDVAQTIDPEWVKGKKFPLVLDPTFVFVGTPGTAIPVVDCAVDGATATRTVNDCASVTHPVGAAAGARRMLIKFDQSALPAGAKISDARLAMTLKSTVGAATSVPVDLREAGSAWSTQLTWATKDGTAAWTTGGGDPATTLLASTAVSTVPGTRFSWPATGTPSTALTTVVQRWLTTPASNLGLVLKESAESLVAERLFATTDSTVAADRPTLTLTYTAPPSAPTNVVATPQDKSALVQWVVPPSNGAPITANTVKALRADNTVAATVTAAAAATSATVTGLVNGTSYYFLVSATNSLGAGPTGRSSAVIPAGVPLAPTAVKATVADGHIPLTWTAANANGSPITKYDVALRLASDSSLVTTVPAAATATSADITGIVNGTTYFATVQASNAIGAGAISTKSANVIPAGVPGAPGSLTGVGGNAFIDLSWTAAAANGRALTGYSVTTLKSSDNSVVATKTVAATATTTRVTALTNGTSYYFRVTASNAIGAGAPAVSGAVSAGLVPGQPASVTATAGDRSVSVAWTPPAAGGTVSSYQVVARRPDSTIAATGTATATARSISLTGLLNGSSYVAGVVAVNVSGSGAERVSSSFVPAGTPLAPTLTAVTSGNQSLSVGWQPAPANGSAVTGYIVKTYTPSHVAVNTQNLPPSATSVTVTGLTNGTLYTIEVAATNTVGTGTLAITSPTAPQGLPAAPPSVTAQRSDGQAVITWTAAPANGPPITAYRLTVSTAGGTVVATIDTDGATLSATALNLANGTSYTATVRATNSVGTGAGTTSAAFTPAGVPAAPSGVSAAVNGTDAVVSWTASSGNGDPVSSYTVIAHQSPGGQQFGQPLVVSGPTATATFHGLDHFASYYFSVTATNSVGDSPLRDSNSVRTDNPAEVTTLISTGAVSTLAGTGVNATVAGVGSAAGFASPRGVVVVAGFAYVGTSDAIMKVELSTGQSSVLAGRPGSGGCGDAPVGGSVTLGGLTDLATDGTFLYSASSCGSVRRTSLATGGTSTIGQLGGSVYPLSVTFAGDGYLYATGTDWQVYRIDPVSNAVSLYLSFPSGVAAQTVTSDADELFVAVTSPRRIVRVSLADKSVSTLLTDGGIGGSTLESAGGYLYGSAVAATGGEVLLRRYSKADGSWANIAGAASGYRDGVGAEAWFQDVSGVASDGTNLFVVDQYDARLRKVTTTSPLPAAQPSSANTAAAVSTGAVSTLAGTGSPTSTSGFGSAAGLKYPSAVVTLNGYAYVGTADTISKVNLLTGELTFLVGTGDTATGPGVAGCGDSVSSATVSGVQDLATDGTFLYSTSSCGNIRRTSIATGATSTVTATLEGNSPFKLTFAGDGFLYATASNYRIYRIDPINGTVSGFADFSGSDSAYAITSDADELFVSVVGPNWTPRIDRISLATKVIQTIAADGLLAPSSLTSAGAYLYGPALYVAGPTSEHSVLRRYAKSDGSWQVVAGSLSAFQDGVGADAWFRNTNSIASDGTNLYVADYFNNRLRVVSQATYFPQGGEAFGYDSYTGWVGDVNPALGNYVTSATDADVNTVGPDLTVTRTYNSSDPNDGPFGRGWNFNHGMTWELDGNGNVAFLYPDGRRETHKKQPGGWFAPPSGYSSKAVAVAGGGYTLTLKDGTLYTFGGDKKLVSVADANGRSLTYSYVNGQLDTATSASGRALHFTWNAAHHISDVMTDAVNGTGLRWQYYYNPSGELIQVCDPAVACTAYEITVGRVTKVTKPLGTTSAVIGYQADGRVQFREDGLGNFTRFDYSGASTVEVTDAAGNKARQSFDDKYRLVGKSASYTTGSAPKPLRPLTYDARGFRDSVQDQNGKTATSTYDTDGNALTATDRNAKTSYLAYDAASNVVAERDARSASASDDSFKTGFTYDGRHNKLSETSATGAVSSWAYSAGGELGVDGLPIAGGLLLSSTDARQHTTSYAYDSRGDQRQIITPKGLRTTFTYDAAGRKTSETEYSTAFPAGVSTSFSYDPNGRETLRVGPIVTNVVTGRAQQLQTATGYDANGNVLSVTASDLVAGGEPARTTGYSYDALDRQTDVVDAETGASVHTTFDVVGRVIRRTDQLGRTQLSAYDENGNPTRVTLLAYRSHPWAAARDIVLESATYDDEGRKLTATDANGVVRSFAYDDEGQVLTVTLVGYVDQDGLARDIIEEQNGYDAAGQLVDARTGGGLRRTLTEYDGDGRVTKTTLDPAGLNRVTTNSYDALGNELTVTVSGGGRTETTTNTYDAESKPLTRTVENGAQDLTTSFDYDDRGLLVGQVDPRGNAAGGDPAAFRTSTAYDALRRPVRVTSPPVSVEATGGAAVLTAVVTETGYNAFGDATQAHDARGQVTTSSYDRQGRRIRVDYPDYLRPDGQQLTDVHESYVYDDAGNMTARWDRRGYKTDFYYDSQNRLGRQVNPRASGESLPSETTSFYDNAGHKVSETDPRGAVHEWTYDKLGNVQTDTALVRQGAGPDERDTSVFGYDDAGQRTYSRDPVGAATTEAFDGAGEVVRRTDASNAVWLFDYDVAGRPVAATDPLGRRTASVFDLAGRRTAARRYDRTDALLPDGTSYSYDAAGNLTRTTSARGFTDDSSFDALGRVTAVTKEVVKADASAGTVAKSVTTAYGYDAAGNLTRTTNGRGYSTTYTNSPWNQRESTVEPPTAATPNLAERTYSTSYDTGGLPVRDDAPGGVSIARSFDQRGELLVENGTGAGPAVSRSFGYDLGGLRTSISHPTAPIQLAYDDRARLTSVTGGAGASTFGYDAAGQMTSRQDAGATSVFTWNSRGTLASARDSLTSVTRTYTWDAAGQLNHVAFTGGAARDYGYDEYGRLTSDTLTAAGGSVSAATAYEYDADGNTSAQVITAPGNSAAGRHTYTNDGQGQLTGWTSPTGSSTSYAWDDAGNRISADGAASTYDARNRLLTGPAGTYDWSARGTLNSITSSGSTTSYGFDAFDRDTGAAGSTFSYDGLDRVASRGAEVFRYAGAEIDPVAVGAARHARSPGGDMLATSDGTTSWITGRNAHGDLTQLFDGTGALAGSKVYSPFGEIAGSVGTASVLGYQSDYTDAASGDVWMGARWYQPGSATFTGRDTYSGIVQEPGSLNRYSYTMGNPLRFFDPDGHEPHLDPATGEWVDHGAEMPILKDCTCWAPRHPRADDDFNGNTATVKNFTISKRPGYGAVWIGLFISACDSGFFGKHFAGDCRTFDENAGVTNSRAFIEINFETGNGFVRANPTCKVGRHSCHDALNFGGFSILRTAVTMKNRFSVSETSDGALAIRYSLLNSMAPRFIAASIDGRVSLAPDPQNVGAMTRHISYRDGYPSMEIYQGHCDTDRIRTLALYREKKTYNLISTE